MADYTVISPVTVIAASGAALTLGAVDNAVGFDRSYDVTLTGNCTVTLAAQSVARMQTISARFKQDATGGRTLTFAGSVSWSNNQAPTFTGVAGRFDAVQFSTLDGGATWLATPIALNVVGASLPSAPSIIVVPGDGRNTINVTPPPANPAITGYRLYRGSTAGGETLIGNVSLTGGSYADTGRSNDLTVDYYQLSAVNAIGEGARSLETSGQSSPLHYMTTANNGYAFAPYKAAYSSQNNPIDVRVKIMALKFASLTGTLAGTWLAADGGSEFKLYFDATTARLAFAYLPATGAAVYQTATVALPTADFPDNSIRWVRATRDPVTGVTTFFYSVDNAATWVQLGATVTATAAAIKKQTNTRTLTLGQSAGGPEQFVGRTYEAQLLISGTLVANPITGPLAAGTTTFPDNVDATVTWTVGGGAVIV